MLIGAIGLLGAIALLPVASEQARKGRQADATAIAGEAFVNEIVARRWFDPGQLVGLRRANYLLHYQNKCTPTVDDGPRPAAEDRRQFLPRSARFHALYEREPNYRVFPYGTSTGPWMHRIGIPARNSSGPRGYNYSPAEQAFTDLICTFGRRFDHGAIAKRSLAPRAADLQPECADQQRQTGSRVGSAASPGWRPSARISGPPAMNTFCRLFASTTGRCPSRRSIRRRSAKRCATTRRRRDRRRNHAAARQLGALALHTGD